MFTIIHAQAVSDMGCVRQNNEDMILLNGEYYRDESATQQFRLPHTVRFKALVADGMGGTEGGEFASELALQDFEDFADAVPDGLSDFDLREAVTDWTNRTHQHILQKGVEFPQYNQMGTTLTGLFGYGDRIYLINIGDSRTYCYRDHSLKQLSRDHSLRELHQDPTIPSNLIYNCLGGGAAEAFADLTNITDQVRPDDRYIICSDGLCDMISDNEIASIIGQAIEHAEEDKLTAMLTEAAKAAGGKDNISILLLHFLEEQPQQTNVM